MEDEEKPYLNETQINTGISALNNIEDKLMAIRNELTTREKPYKRYLREKLDSIYWDVKVLMNMTKEDKEGE